ncbi:Crp/Fnr family transcriptional regulator [Dyadobacter psychrotolerans]|uniref:Crp/Fnr family transcriptional regulator n=1 Tax=Dyadobacter psychrotolerans TaxID=2541721 RepID=A0A4R5DRJ7_9BACT|nr:Crp/Fnr family transcriptional regulator [Dyadobacter psychrotolerans]TDE13695.1 Crp/Fnr family transcriptional regulator [Dyadobacter psychrotolerans]
MENTIRKIVSLNPAEICLSRLVPLLQKEIYPKGYLLIREGKTERSLFFLEKGVARAFCNQDDKEVTFWFGEEADILLSLNSYFADKPGYESIELLEESIVYKVSHRELQRLYDLEIELANWGRKLAESEFIKADQRFISQQFKPAAERYREFTETYPGLSKRIQLGHIASYLGISQVSLSRIRGERQ